MESSWSEEQMAFKQQAIDLARKLESGGDSDFPRANWQACADAGILGLRVPEGFGGRPDVDISTAALIMEGMGYGCRDNGLTFALNTHRSGPRSFRSLTLATTGSAITIYPRWWQVS